MMLSDKDLKMLALDYGLVTPFIPENCEGATIDITLGNNIKKLKKTSDKIIMGQKVTEDDYENINLMNEKFELQPGESILIQSNEYFKIPVDKTAQFMERYSVKLLGLLISPSSYMNPGYEGTMSFVAYNQTSVPIEMVPGIKFAQLAVFQLTSSSEKPYHEQDAKYLGSNMVNISKLHMDTDIQDFLVSSGIPGVNAENSKLLGEFLLKKIDVSAERIAEELREKFGDLHEQ